MWLKLLQAFLAAIAVVWAGFWRALRQLFHEVTGALFLFFAVFGGVSAWRHWQRGSEAWLIVLSAAFTLMMAAFAVISFRSARKVR